MQGTNAPYKPAFERQVVHFTSPHPDAILFDIAKPNPKHRYLEWCALNEPTTEQQHDALFVS